MFSILPSAAPNNWNLLCQPLKFLIYVPESLTDDPDCKIYLKAFYCAILFNHAALKKEQDSYKDIQVIRKMDNMMV